MISEFNIVIEAVEGERTTLYCGYIANGVGYTADAEATDEEDILTSETDMGYWLRGMLAAGVNHVLNLESYHPTDPIQAKFCLIIKHQESVISTKIGMVEVEFVEDGYVSLCKLYYDMIPTIFN